MVPQLPPGDFLALDQVFPLGGLGGNLRPSPDTLQATLSPVCLPSVLQRLQQGDRPKSGSAKGPSLCFFQTARCCSNNLTGTLPR